MTRFEKMEGYPDEIQGRFNSFITTQFDDSLSVEMQIRSLIKWINSSRDLINNMVDYINLFIEMFDERLQEEIVLHLNEWLADGTLAQIINNDVFDMKADKTFVDSEIERLEQKDKDIVLSQEQLEQNITLSQEQLEQNITLSQEQLEQLKQNMFERFDNITIDITQEPYNVPTDSESDATDSIQYALDNVPIRSKILLPKGTYKITKPLIISRELTFEGSGSGENGGTLLSFHLTEEHSERHAIEMKSTAKNGKMRNLYLKNENRELSEIFGLGNKINEPALTHYEFYNVWSVGFTAGFYFNKIYLSTFKGCYAVQGYYGFRFRGHSTSLIFEKCYANVNTDNWVLENMIYSTLISCASDDAKRYGYFLKNVDSISLVSCGAENCDRTGIHLEETNAVNIQSFFTTNCGLNAPAGVGASGQIEFSNKSTIINGFYEEKTHISFPGNSSLVFTSGDNMSSANGVVVTKNLYTTPNVSVNGQKRSNVKPEIGTYKTGDFVFNTVGSNSVLGWRCTVGGSPGTWVEISI